MNLFKKQQTRAQPTATVRRTAAPRSRRPDHLPATSPNQAMQRVHAAAEEAREEIARLVQAEHEAIDEAITANCQEAEERLRGATERRIDSEIKRSEEAAAKLRRELKRLVKAEVAKATKQPPSGSDSNSSVPIRARA